jgi:NOL1/NOP2/fmu family ribosome biogenesis protein
MKEESILEYFENRFGIPKGIFSDFRLYSDQKGRVLLGPKNLASQDIAVSVGMQVAKVMNGGGWKSAEPSFKRVKPSTNFLQIFGKHAKKNFISINKEQAKAYIKGEDVILHTVPAGIDEGYILVKYLDYPLGCGFLKQKELRNVLPKARRMKAEFL